MHRWLNLCADRREKGINVDRILNHAFVYVCSLSSSDSSLDEEFIEIAASFLREEEIDVNQVGTDYVPLHAATNPKLVSLLLSDEKINVNQAAECDGSTALCIATANGRTDIVSLLLDKKGIDVNLAMVGNKTPIYLASANGHHEVVSTILRKQGSQVHAEVIECIITYPFSG